MQSFVCLYSHTAISILQSAGMHTHTMYMYMYILTNNRFWMNNVRDNKQSNTTQHNTTTPETTLFFQRKMSCLRWDSNPRTTYETTNKATQFNTTQQHPRKLLFSKKNELPQVGLPTTLCSPDEFSATDLSALPLSYQGGSDGKGSNHKYNTIRCKARCLNNQGTACTVNMPLHFTTCY